MDSRTPSANTDLAMREPQTLAARYELSVEDLLAQVQKIQALMTKVMREGEHYGVIPGTNKPTLLKPGAEKLCLLFRLDPQYHSVESVDGRHLTVKSMCTLWHIPTGQRMGSGEGSCSTKEAKYAYRRAVRACPVCGSTGTIIKGRAGFGGGWLCWDKRGGCGAKFKDGDPAIERQPLGRVANEDLPDVFNVVLKMSNKRALVAAVLNVTAASDIFTQDLEDLSTTTSAPPLPEETEVIVDAAPTPMPTPPPSPSPTLSSPPTPTLTPAPTSAPMSAPTPPSTPPPPPTPAPAPTPPLTAAPTPSAPAMPTPAPPPSPSPSPPPTSPPSPTPPSSRSPLAAANAHEREQLNALIVKLGDELKLKAGARAALWEQFCRGATPLDADLSALHDLVGELTMRVRAQPKLPGA
jgi:hypothetical protein